MSSSDLPIIVSSDFRQTADGLLLNIRSCSLISPCTPTPLQTSAMSQRKRPSKDPLPEAAPVLAVSTINQRLQEHLHQSLENYIGLSDMFDKQCTTMNTVYAKLNQSRVLAKQLQRHIRLQRDRIIELELLLKRHDVSPPDMSEEYRCSSPPCPIESFEDAIPESNMRDSVYLPN